MPVSARKLDHLLVNVLGFERRMGKHVIYDSTERTNLTAEFAEIAETIAVFWASKAIQKISVYSASSVVKGFFQWTHLYLQNRQ